MNLKIVISLLSLSLSVSVVFSESQPKHFLGTDECQYWKFLDKQTNLKEELLYTKTEEGLVFEHRYFTDDENLFSKIWDFTREEKYELKQNPNDQEMVTCEISSLTGQEELQTLMQQSWSDIFSKAEFKGKNGNSKTWSFEGTTGLEIEYQEKEGEPHWYILENEVAEDDQELERKMKVKKFFTNCDKVAKKIKEDRKLCKNSIKNGNTVYRANDTTTTSKRAFLGEKMHGSIKPISEYEHKWRERCTLTGMFSAGWMSAQYGVQHYGNHCGAGSDVLTDICCGRACADGGLDNFCLQHDASAYYESYYGLFTLMSCYTSRKLIDDATAFDGCVGDANSPWRLSPDSTGAETCRNIRDSISTSFSCSPCTNYECSSKWDWSSWKWVNVCQWVTYYATWPSQLTCDGSCYNNDEGPFDYSYNIAC